MRIEASIAVALVCAFASDGAAGQALQTAIRAIWIAPGNGPANYNTFYVLTPGGPAVIIDTSGATLAATHKSWIQAIPGYVPPAYVIVTHGHGDHTAGVAQWKATGNPVVIAQANQAEQLNYQLRLAGFFNYRNSADLAIAPPPLTNPNPGDFAAAPLATLTFQTSYSFSLGGLTFNLLSAPGETPDMLNVWIPELQAYFIGDNWYRSFPNLGSPRGTKSRWALDYVNSLNLALAHNAVMLLPSHGSPVTGTGSVAAALTNYRDTIQNVHDQVVACLNAQFATPNTCQNANGPPTLQWLMQNIHAPATFTLGESYGRVAWGVRAIAQDYIGWFDIPDGATCPMCVGDAQELFPDTLDSSASSLEAVLGTGHNDGFISADMASAATSQSRAMLSAGQSPVKAARLADLALRNDSGNTEAITLKFCALTALAGESNNFTEHNWLLYNASALRAALGATVPDCSFIPGRPARTADRIGQ